MVLFLALLFHERLVPRRDSQTYKVIDAIFRSPLVLEEKPANVEPPCPLCSFAWTHAGCIEGVYSLGSSATFRSFVILADKTKFGKCVSENGDLARYTTICTVLIAPIIRKAQSESVSSLGLPIRLSVDDWLIRLTMIDALPLMFDLVFPYIPPKDLEALIERGWLGLLVNDDHVSHQLRP